MRKDSLINQDDLNEVAVALQNYDLAILPQLYSYPELLEKLTARLNDLIANNFSLLISILYRVDISEKKLKGLLREAKDTTAGQIIAEMIIERQLQKIAIKRAFKETSTKTSDEETW